jgi:hypothetical protein
MCCDDHIIGTIVPSRGRLAMTLQAQVLFRKLNNVCLDNHRLAIRAWRGTEGSCDASIDDGGAAMALVIARPPWLELLAR